jgi:hypothetical protein
MRKALAASAGLGLAVLAAVVTVACAKMEPAPQEFEGDKGTAVVAIGGSMQNQNDLCWILFREKAKDREERDYDRYALCLYRAMQNGQLFDLVDVREVTYDPKLVQLAVRGHDRAVSPAAIKEAWEKSKKEEEERRRREKEEEAKKAPNK